MGSSVDKARMLKQGMSPMGRLSGSRARDRQLHHIRVLTFKTSTTLTYVVSGTLPSAKVPSEADCLLYPTLILPFFHSVRKYSRSSDLSTLGASNTRLTFPREKGNNISNHKQFKQNLREIDLRAAKGTVIKRKIARRSISGLFSDSRVWPVLT